MVKLLFFLFFIGASATKVEESQEFSWLQLYFLGRKQKNNSNFRNEIYMGK